MTGEYGAVDATCIGSRHSGAEGLCARSSGGNYYPATPVKKHKSNEEKALERAHGSPKAVKKCIASHKGKAIAEEYKKKT